MKNDIKLSFNDDLGIMYIPASNRLFDMDVATTKKMLNLYTRYNEDNLTQQDKRAFESYIDKMAGNQKNLKEGGLFSTNKLRKLEIMVTNYCNLQCRYCYANSGTYDRKPMYFSREHVIDKLKEVIPSVFNAIDTVFFFGGEPLLNFPAIEGTLDFFYKMYHEGKVQRLPFYTMVTNGMNVNEHMADILAMNHVAVTVSLDGPQDIHDQLRVDPFGEGTYQQVVDAIELMRRKGVDVRAVEATYTQLHMIRGISRKDLEEFIKGQFPSINVYVADCGGENAYALTQQQQDVNCITKKDYLDIFQKLYRQETKNYSCDICEGSFMMAPDGNYYPCHMFYDDPSFAFTMRSYESIRKWVALANRTNYAVCKNCWARYLCNVCPATLIQYYQPDSQELKNLCEKRRNKIENILLLIAEDARHQNRNCLNCLEGGDYETLY